MKRKCEICGRESDKYLPINPCFRQEQEKYGYQPAEPETLNEEEYVCRYCQATDRERMCADFLNKILQKKLLRLNVLEVAPSQAITRFFQENYPSCAYKTADLFMEGVDYKMDVQDMKGIRDGQFDIVICFHVLEHVRDDQKALKEFYRIISDHGIGIFLVPIDLRQKNIDEAWGLPKEENIRRFGQADHVRKYSKKGFVERMEKAGFQVLALDTDWFGWKNCRKNAYSETATLYVAAKSSLYDEKNIADSFHKNFFTWKLEKADNRNFKYSIDGIEKNAETVSIWGWIWKESCNSGEKTAILCLKKRNQIFYMKKLSLKSREDVKQIYGEQYENSGIETTLPAGALKKGIYRLEIIFLEGQRAYVVDVKKRVII